tara:strand:- start:2800 stop:3420 length:621 start_codon:yes stop_codon:yes gene_type:complete
MDYVSNLNLWCQKNGISTPKYTFQQYEEQIWECSCCINYKDINTKCVGDNKKQAKQQVAKKILLYINNDNNILNTNNISIQSTKITKITEPMILIIDGDQRMDCWKWLISDRIQLSKDVRIEIYLSPIAPTLEIPPDKSKNFTIYKAKTPSRDSADSLILMSLGVLLYTEESKKIIIVSSDHVLVQAAIDNDIEWAPNLKELKQKL